MTFEERLGRALQERNWTVSTVESCTAGGLAYRITEMPGASAYFFGGLVAYDNRVKTTWAGVPEEIFVRYGAVSQETAAAMAEGGRSRFGSNLCLAITGIAGPGGGTIEKPVGTVFIAASTPAATRTERFMFEGDRENVRQQAINAALEMGLECVAGS